MADLYRERRSLYIKVLDREMRTRIYNWLGANAPQRPEIRVSPSTGTHRIVFTDKGEVVITDPTLAARAQDVLDDDGKIFVEARHPSESLGARTMSTTEESTSRERFTIYGGGPGQNNSMCPCGTEP